MSALPATVSAVVFDCDGLLLDTETAWGRAEAALFADNGLPFGADEKALLLGGTVPSVAARLAEHFGRPGEADVIAADLLARVADELSAGVDPMPGALDLLEALHGRVPLGVASNSPRELLDDALVSAGFDRFFTVTIAADEVDRPKPDPELYLQAFARLGADPLRGITFEDSETGARAARASGAFVVAVPSLPGIQPAHDLIVETLADPRIAAWAATVTAS